MTKTKKKKKSEPLEIKNRITDFKMIRASRLLPNPQNWRLHNDKQRAAFRAIVDEVGWAGAELCYYSKENDGKLTLVDGHMRREEAGDEKIPCLITDLDDDEARKLLAAYDPISAMAGIDAKPLKSLLQSIDISPGHEELVSLFSELGKNVKGGLDLEVDADDGEVEVNLDDEEDIEESHVRMVQLFFNTKTMPKFEKYCQSLMKPFKATNPTDLVLKVLKAAYLEHKK